MQIAIVQFPGSNCERETILAVKRAGMTPVEFLWNEPKEKLINCDGYIIVGGFSYEDRSRSGVIAALDPIIDILKSQSALGKPILGICNGAQILVETGLVPGLEKDELGMALTDNKRIKEGKVLGTGFYNTWVHMRLSAEYQLNAFTRRLTANDKLHIPIAHGEGRFVIPPALLVEMQAHGLNVFQYCDVEGNVFDEFPTNPNGSVNNIAAVSNKAGNVMAMMPHPERTENGDAIFTSMREYIAERNFQKTTPLHYQARFAGLTNYTKKNHELLIELIITDNQALSVENALQRRGIPVKVSRRMHWEIACASAEVYEKIKNSGVLFNDRKEKLVTHTAVQNQTTVLVRAKEDMLGKQKQQMLEDHFDVTGIQALQHGILWQLSGEIQHINQALNSNILFNPYAHDYYHYE